MKIKSDFILPTKKEELILNLLQVNGAMYGLALVKAEPLLKRGSVYVLLGRLENANWVTSYLEDKPDTQAGMPRRFYQISNLGVRILEAFSVASKFYKEIK